MAEYIERETIFRSYVDLCLAKSKLEKARKGGAFFRSDLLPETEISAKEWVRLIMAVPAADVAPVRHARWELTGTDKRGRGGNWKCTGRDGCGKSYPYKCDYCPNCGAKMDLEG